MTNPTADDLTSEDLAEVESMAQGIIDGDKRRYEAVMAEIDKEEREILERLRKIRMRRAAVQKAGHYGK